MSFDAPAKNQQWAEAQKYEFELWTDASRALALHYGAASSASASAARRVTRLLGADGSVVLEYSVGSDIPAHPGDVLSDSRILFGG